MAHILVVDDEYPVRFLIRKVLESAGHRIVEAASGQESLDLLRTHPTPFDLIVLDVRMPLMDGFELLAILRRQPARRDDPVLKPMPVTRQVRIGAVVWLPISDERLTRPCS